MYGQYPIFVIMTKDFYVVIKTVASLDEEYKSSAVVYCTILYCKKFTTNDTTYCKLDHC